MYPITLAQAGLAVGILLFLSHAVAFVQPDRVSGFLRGFPRSVLWGRILLVIAAAWSFWLIGEADLGEFSHLVGILKIGVPVAAVLAWFFVDDFLSVRALGTIALLAAEPLLSAAFMQAPMSRLLLVVLAYVWILAGLFLVGMPYLLRDAITWITSRASLFKSAAAGGIAYGLALILCSVLFWR